MGQAFRFLLQVGSRVIRIAIEAKAVGLVSDGISKLFKRKEKKDGK